MLMEGTVDPSIFADTGKIRNPFDFTPPYSNYYCNCKNVWIDNYLCLIAALKPSSLPNLVYIQKNVVLVACMSPLCFQDCIYAVIHRQY